MVKIKVYMRPLASKEENISNFKQTKTLKGNFGYGTVKGKTEIIDEIEYYEA